MSFLQKLKKVSGRALCTAFVVLNVAVLTTVIQAAESSFEKAAAACEAAKASFRPLTPADLQSIKAELSAAVKRLDERLTAAATTGEGWRKYIQWGALQEELGRDEPKRDVLIGIYQRLTAGEEGLNLIWFVEVQRALRQYLKVSEDINNPNLKTVFEQNLDRLAAALKAYSTKPTIEDALTISDSLRWLKTDRQAAELERSVEQLFGQPNLLAEINDETLAAGLSEPVDETTPIQDCILGTSINGTGHTVGNVTSKVAESDRFSVIDTFLMATTNASTVGYHDPVYIYSNSTTHIGAVKRLWIDEEGIFSLPASSNAITNTTICDIQSIKGRRIVERIAWKQAGKQKGEAECVGSLHAQARVNARMDERGAESLGQANENFQKKFRRPLLDHKLFPEELKFSSTDKAMLVRSMQAGTSLIAAPTAPPEVEKGDITLKIHESMINNYALDALGGMTIRQEQAEKGIIDVFGELPEKMKTDPNEEPWGIIFAKKQPVAVSFADDGFKVTIHGAGYYKGDAPQPAMDVTANYKVVKTETGFKAVREGDLQIFPPGFDMATGQLSVKHQTIRHLLEKRFGKVFEPEIIPQPLVLKGKLEKAGKLVPTQFVARDGWLVLAWKRVPPDVK